VFYSRVDCWNGWQTGSATLHVSKFAEKTDTQIIYTPALLLVWWVVRLILNRAGTARSGFLACRDPVRIVSALLEGAPGNVQILPAFYKIVRDVRESFILPEFQWRVDKMGRKNRVLLKLDGCQIAHCQSNR
jgi:hypothetical protein